MDNPGEFADLLIRGVQAHKRGDPLQALGLITSALRVNPASFDALLQQGLVLRALERSAEALASYDKALAIQPESADVLYNRGNALLELSRYQEALASYERALAIRPDDPEALNNCGNALRALGRHEEALAGYDRALAVVPGYAKALGNRGPRQPEEALASYRMAFTAAPEAAWMLGIGNALQALDRHQEALESYDRALAIKPGSADAHGARGNALQALNRHEDALSSYTRALAIQPDNAESHWNEALARLTLGDYREGWKKYEWRWLNPSLKSPRRVSGKPLWLGDEDIAGRTVLLHAEQGYGDTIQAIRYAPHVAARGATVLVMCQTPLRSLFESVEGVGAVVTHGQPLPEYECHVPLMSLPLAFRTTVDTIPAQVPYLRPSEARVQEWRRKLGVERDRLKVGLAWMGNPEFSRARTKSCPAERLIPLIGSANCTFFSLQTGEAASEASKFTAGGRTVVDYSRDLGSFEDTAAMISALDLVITIDTAVAHLAGALARPVWILLPFAADWRWFRVRTDSPWYPTARLFRQPRAGDWESVIAAVSCELARVAMK